MILNCYLGYTPQFQRSPFLWLHVHDLGSDWDGSIPRILMPVCHMDAPQNMESE